MKREMFCLACGAVGTAKSHTRGSLLIEIALWLLFILPGIIYSIWRLASRRSVCRTCLQPSLIPLDSPRAKAALGQP